MGPALTYAPPHDQQSPSFGVVSLSLGMSNSSDLIGVSALSCSLSKANKSVVSEPQNSKVND